MKDYQAWHTLKSTIQHSYPEKLFREREIWWCSVGANVGFEQDGKNQRFERPVLILRKFNRGMFWGLPMTSQAKQGKFYASFLLKNSPVTAIVSQLRVLSSKRLIRRISRINEAVFIRIEDMTIALLKEKETDSLRSPRVPYGNL